MRILYLFALIFLALASVCGLITPSLMISPEPAGVPVDTILIERGIEVYRVNYCGSCHALAAANTRGTFGPAHDHAGILAEQHLAQPNYQGSATTAAEYIRESILDPRVFYTPGYEATNHHMPAFTHLPDEDIDALVYMLLHQRENSQ